MWKEFLNCNSDRKKFIELLPTFFEQQRENVKEEVEQNSEN
jgi:hypothetical protein